jgi:CVNH domain/CHAT domain
MNSDTPAKKILILAANPKQTSRLRLDEEVRDIKEGLRLSQQRDKFILQQEWAVRPRDVRRAVLDFRPNIIHFSGHGSGSTGLSFEDETGKEKLVTSVALAGLFGQFAKQVECVVLNACYSEEQAVAIAKHIDYVIGMNAAIGDKAALEFAVGFYDALVAYDSRYDTYSRIEFSFNIACNAIQFAGVSGDSIPIMKKKPHLGKVEEQAIVNPVEESRLSIDSSTYQLTCQNISIEGDKLSATCRKINGSYNPISIRILGIENNDGELKYSSNPFSESTYQHTCKDISISGDQLSAICRKIDGSFSPTVSSIKIRGISNQDGNFSY